MKISILQITKDCNQDCFYCTRDRDVKDETIDTIKKKIDGLDNDVKQIIVTGGEPSLKEDMLDIIRYASRKAPVHLQTNGINFADDNFCRQVLKAGVSSVLIALPSFSKETVEKIAQTKDIFEKKIKAVENLSRYKDIDVGVVFVVNKLNYREFPDYVKIVSKISRDIYIQITYMIRYTKNIEKIRPRAVRLSDFRPYLDKGLRLCNKYNIQYRIDGIPLCFVQNHLDFVSDIRDYDFVEDFIDKKTKKYDSWNYEGKEHVKPEKCKACKLNHKCKGVYEYYSNIFGTNELKPVK